MTAVALKRFIVTNRTTSIYAGMYYCEVFARKQLQEIAESWPGLEWEVEPTDFGFPVPGLICIGETRAKRILKASSEAEND